MGQNRGQGPGGGVGGGVRETYERKGNAVSGRNVCMGLALSVLQCLRTQLT